MWAGRQAKGTVAESPKKHIVSQGGIIYFFLSCLSLKTSLKMYAIPFIFSGWSWIFPLSYSSGEFHLAITFASPVLWSLQIIYFGLFNVAASTGFLNPGSVGILTQVVKLLSFLSLSLSLSTLFIPLCFLFYLFKNLFLWCLDPLICVKVWKYHLMLTSTGLELHQKTFKFHSPTSSLRDLGQVN